MVDGFGKQQYILVFLWDNLDWLESIRTEWSLTELGAKKIYAYG